MNEYFQVNYQIAKKEEFDPVSLEDFKVIEHPRKIILIRRENNIPYPYLTETVHNIIRLGNNCDPITRKPFSQLTKQRVSLYYKGVCEFPNYKINKKDLEDLFKRWEKNLSEKKDEMLKTEASCFLQIEDLLDMFFKFNGKGSLSNREEAEKILSTSERIWLLRYGSFKETQFNKGYVFSFKREEKFQHHPILHKIGEGFYLDAIDFREQLLTDDLESDLGFPSIIDLIEYILKEKNLI